MASAETFILVGGFQGAVPSWTEGSKHWSTKSSFWSWRLPIMKSCCQRSSNLMRCCASLLQLDWSGTLAFQIHEMDSSIIHFYYYWFVHLNRVVSRLLIYTCRIFQSLRNLFGRGVRSSSCKVFQIRSLEASCAVLSRSAVVDGCFGFVLESVSEHAVDQSGTPMLVSGLLSVSVLIVELQCWLFSVSDFPVCERAVSSPPCQYQLMISSERICRVNTPRVSPLVLFPRIHKFFWIPSFIVSNAESIIQNCASNRLSPSKSKSISSRTIHLVNFSKGCSREWTLLE